MKRALLVLLLAGCKLLHRGSNDKDKDFPVDTTTPPPTVTVAASAPPIESASAAPSASALVEDALDAGAAIDPRIAARQKALREAAEFGMLGMLSDAGLGGSPWGREPYETNPPIGLGNIGTLGGISHYDAGAGSRHATVRAGATTVLGRLPPEVIQRIVRQNFGRFRLCYENGLRNNPMLQGRVVTKYVILADGTVTTTADGGSDMPDQNVVQCVMRAFRGISYPQPEGGIVTVTFPLIFNPS